MRQTRAERLASKWIGLRVYFACLSAARVTFQARRPSPVFSAIGPGFVAQIRRRQLP